MKKILLILFVIFVLFASMGAVFSADTNGTNTNDNNKNTNETAVKNSADNSKISRTSSTNNYKITVTHNKVEHGKPIHFIVNVKDSDGNPVVNKSFSFSFRSMNDKTNPDGRFDNTVFTDANGVFSVDWPGNSGYFDYYELTISDGLDPNQYPTGTVYYRKAFDLTLKPTMSVSISKSTVYEGQNTQIRVTVKVNGVPASGYLVWKYNKDKSVTTQLKNGVSIFNYNSFILGKNPIVITYIGLGAFPGYIVSNVNKTVNVNIKSASDLIISKIAKYGNRYKVTVKNIGKGKSTTARLRLGLKSRYKTVTITSLNPGKSKTVIVNFNYNKYKKYTKYAWVNYNKACYEKNYKDNKVSFKSKTYIGLLPNLAITKVSRSGNNLIVTIKNQGNAASSGFRILVWYGYKNKGKGYVLFNAKKFGKYGNRLPAGTSATLTLPYIKYKTHSRYYKFIYVNYNKKVRESNYNNNLKRVKI